MDDNNKKLTPEQIQQLQQLQKLFMQKQSELNNNELAGNVDKKEMLKKLLHPKNLFIKFLQFLQNSVKFIDQFIQLVINKNSGNSDVNDVVQSARSPILFGVFITIFFVFLGLIWAGTAPLDSAAVAIGTVVSSSQKKIINHQEGGIIKHIYVKVGDRVKEGDKLLDLDDTRIKSEFENILNQYRTLLATESRLLTEINNEEQIVYPKFLLKDRAQNDVSKILETQNNLFNSKRNLKSAEKDSLKQRIKQLDKQIEGYKAKKIALQKTLEVTQDRLKAIQTLNNKGFVQKSTLLELEAKEANAQSELALTDTEIARSEQEITKTEIDLLNMDTKFSSQTLTELKETQANLAGHRERFFYLQEALNRVVIKSPVDGIVNNINFHTIGSSIPSGQNIIEISPEKDSLVIDAKIDPKNIASIKIGLVSKIRFSAFKSRTTPLFIGKVVSLSPDIIIDHQRSSPADPVGYYLARIELDMNNFKELAEPRQLVLYPGMQAEVQIVTGTRTLLKYLLDPVYDAMFKGFKEK
jgi:HlyD family secretion protein